MTIRKTTLLGIFLLICSTYSFPQVDDATSLIAKSTGTSDESKNDDKQNSAPILPKIYEMKIEANITNRFAKCQVASKVKNLDKKAHEAIFSIIIPDSAYISGFVMEIDGKKYEAYVQEKEQAKNTYKNAVNAGQAAAHVAVSARDSNRFTVSVNVEPQKKAIFYLKYEELLDRQNERYELVINIHPGQPVKQLDVQVNIDETRPIKFVKAPPLRSGNEITKNDEKLNPNADIQQINKTSAVVKFSPDIEKQKAYASGLGTDSANGLAGQFVVQYDVERDPQGGEVLVNEGYFVHFFAPSDLQPLPKQVVFILDTSGSMEGIRITQLKEAMKSILSELKKEDVFSIVEFGSVVKVWNIEKSAIQYQSGSDQWGYPEETEAVKNLTTQPLPPPYPATEDNIKNAETVVERLNAFGGTDIDSALKIGLQLVQKNQEDKKHQPIVVFLTDGEATVGETNNDKIIKSIVELNIAKTPIFSLSFGEGADRVFLQKVSLKNQGFARHIYEAADASQQLQEFYKQISSPLLSHVTFKYVSNATELTRTEFPILFSGSELVVSGQIDPGFAPPIVEGWGINGPVKLTPVIQNSVGNLERLWAYLKLRQILEQREAADNKTLLTNEALRIALKYSFVSDVTSLVVVKPNKTDAVDTEDGSDKRYPIIASGIPLIGKAGAARPYPVSLSANSYAQASGSVDYSNLYLEAEEDVLTDRVYNGGGSNAPLNIAPSTTHRNHVFTTSITHPPSPLPEESGLNKLKESLPWLAAILGEDEVLTLKSGKFKLGLNETISTNPECKNSLKEAIGNCTLIANCPQILPELTDVNVYEKYFCDLQGFAGVCCPKQT